MVTVARVGPQRSPVYEHLPRSFGFGGTDSLPIVTRPLALGQVAPDLSCGTGRSFAVHSQTKGGQTRKGKRKRPAVRAELKASESVVVAAKQGSKSHHSQC